MKVCHTLVGSWKGGVGKTTLSLAIANALMGYSVLSQAKPEVLSDAVPANILKMLRQTNRETSIVDVDVPAGQQTGQSWIVGSYANAIPMTVQPTVSEIVTDPTVMQSHFDELGVALQSQIPHLVDFGAGVVDPFLTWAEDSGMPRIWAKSGTAIKFVVPVTADEHAMKMAYDVLKRVSSMCRPAGVDLSLFLALNSKDGLIKRVEASSDWKRLVDMKEPPTEVVMMPFAKCISEIWVTLPQLGLSPIDIIAMTVDEISQRFPKIPPTMANRSYVHLAQWFHDLLKSMIEVGLLDVTDVAAKLPAGGSTQL